MKKPLNVPKFNNEAEEADWWASIDLSEYVEPSDMKRVSFPNLKPTSTPISVRIPNYMINRLKEKANAINVPYQSLIKQYIEKGLSGRL
jgi:predicted DNA binding CopG/RHH family protein